MFRLLLSPRLIGLHLLVLVATTAAAWLGLWQYDAWQLSRDAAATNLANAAPKELDDVMSPDDPFPGDAVGQPVRFAGEWVANASFLVSDRKLRGSNGYWVVTPVAVCTGGCRRDPAMLVVRGWVAQADAAPEAPVGGVRVQGWLQPPEDTGRQDPDPGDDVLQEVRIADAIQRVEQDLYGGYVIAEEVVSTLRQAQDTATSTTEGGSIEEGATDQGLKPVTPGSLPEPETFTALRNLLYAFEWWVFGAFTLFVWWRWCSDAVRSGQREVVSTLRQAQDTASSTTKESSTTRDGSTIRQAQDIASQTERKGGSTDGQEDRVAGVASIP